MARQLLTLGIGVAPHRGAWEGVGGGEGAWNVPSIAGPPLRHCWLLIPTSS